MHTFIQEILKYNPELRMVMGCESDYTMVHLVVNEIRRRRGITEENAEDTGLFIDAAFIVGYHVAKHPELLIFEQPDLKNAELYPQHLFPNLISTCKARDETAGR